MSSSSRTQILDGALDMLKVGDTVSLESAARRAGLSKPGVMYHFPSKETLMIALVDHAIDGWEGELTTRLPVTFDRASPRQRYCAYLDWALSGRIDQGDLVVFADPKLRPKLMARWVERLSPWLDLPTDLPTAERDAYTAVRLIADGACYADALDVLALDAGARARLRALAERLLEVAE